VRGEGDVRVRADVDEATIIITIPWAAVS
jgi:hypothetical protein